MFLAYLRAHLIFNVFDNAQAVLGIRGICLLTEGHLGKLLPTDAWVQRSGTAKWFKQTPIAKRLFGFLINFIVTNQLGSGTIEINLVSQSLSIIKNVLTMFLPAL